MLGGNMISALIFGVVGIAVVLLLWNVVQPANAEVYNQFVSHCKIQNKAVTRLVATSPASAVGMTTNVTKGTGTGCTAAGVTGGLKYSDEYGRNFDSTAADNQIPVLTNGVWTVLPTFMSRFAAINRLLASVLPLLYVLSILGHAYGIYKGMGGSVMANLLLVIGKVVIYVVGVILLPVLIGFIGDAAGSHAAGAALAVNDTFGSITDLGWSLTPTILLLGLMILAPVGTGFYSAAYSRIRGGM